MVQTELKFDSRMIRKYHVNKTKTHARNKLTTMRKQWRHSVERMKEY